MEITENNFGTLFLVATPIGNLEDMTIRAIRTLKEVNLIAAEDTRNSRKLLNAYEIKTPMISYHEHNKWERGSQLVDKLENGVNIALISDAGTPGISDPGEELVRECKERGIEVVPIPGATAFVSALTACGLSAGQFTFVGFLSRLKKDREKALESLKDESNTILFYEAPHRLQKTLTDIKNVFGEREIALCKELTKKHEKTQRTTLSEAIIQTGKEPPRGEYVIVVEGKSEAQLKQSEQSKWEEISVTEHVELYIKQGMDKKTAMKQAAKDRGVGKRDIYSQYLQTSP
ncbi:MAG: 16S rRNA (cytidine(1402)-2'-O)-methyltransferase [Lachnospiraceae bacterium]|jgi:16S rRNA (cytidine1402-2'-O)-methyltransferase|nr:16S rRNA (cytidine(1402)-2'-O)-methyltransferase [Lachnospiraceae bacterium]